MTEKKKLCSGFSGADVKDVLKAGDILEFGTYPQSEVTDGKLLTALDALEKSWKSCGGDFSIQFADVLYQDKKYRAVRFSSYRLTCTDCQKNNGYTLNKVYYFRYDPVRWRVLDIKTGLILSETILDSQAFNDHITNTVNYHLEYGSVHDAVNIYERSSIRQWLNDEFLHTAFTPAQQELIEKRPYSVSNPEDRIFLINAGDAAFVFFSSSDARQAKGSDYAKCCGLEVDAENGFSAWRLRGGTMSGSVYDTDNLDYVLSDGSVDYNYGTITDASYGVRPALKRKDLSSRVSQKETAVSTAGESTHENIFRKYTGSEETVVIPDGVTIIGIEAFQKCKSLKSIIIPDGVKIIGVKAFDDCENLTSVTLPESVTIIHPLAFHGCNSLKTVYYTGTQAQRDRIEGLAYDSPLMKADWINPKNHSALTKSPSEIREGVLKKYYPEYDQGDTTAVVIPDGITCIGQSAFAGCGDLVNITIPDSVTDIGMGSFCGCVRLQTITIPRGVTSIRYKSFCNCRSLVKVTIPDSVTEIDSRAFEGCGGLTEITLPDSLTSIGSYAFRNCENLTTVILPSRVSVIGNEAFDGCSGLTEIALPVSVSSIDIFAFRGCKSLKTVYYEGTQAQRDRIKGLENDDPLMQADWINPINHSVLPKPSPFKIQAGVLKKYYPEYDQGDTTTVVIPDGITCIGYDAFNGCGDLMNITIPDSVTDIGIDSFRDCIRLQKIAIPHGVTFIRYGAFRGCRSLVNVTIPDSVTEIGSSAFNGCSGLTEITLPASVTVFGDYLFCKCTNLKSVVIPDGVKIIGANTFRDCENLTTLILPAGVSDIDGYAFYGCSSLQTVRYGGTKAQREKISFKPCAGNDCLLNAEWVYLADKR